MIRSPKLFLLPALLAATAAGCGTDHPTGPGHPSTAAAKGGKPGGGGGASGPIGQLLGTTRGSRANAVNATYAVGREAVRATAWNGSGQAIALPVSGSTVSSSAFGINSASVVVGSADAAAVVWRPEGVDAWATAATLPSPPGTWSGMSGYAVNDQGVIAGTGTRSDDLRFALRWTPDADGYSVEVVPALGAEYEFVGSSIANVTGWVAGRVSRNVAGARTTDAFVWTSGTFRLLGRLNGAGGQAWGINAAGRIAGFSASAPKGGDSSPVTWTCLEAGCTPPTVLPMFYRNLNLAMSINDAGDIVGTSGLDGILYSRCGMTPVTLHPPAGWHQSYGWAVSNDGTVAAGYSFFDSGTMQATRWSLPAPGC